MKPYLTQTLTCFVVLLIAASCTKNPIPRSTVERKIHYTLYTNKDFSEDNGTIRFSIVIRNHFRTLFDSAFAPMKIKDIPSFANKIEVEKIVPNNDPSDLSVGFLYAIDGVGNSWHLDTCNAGQTFKVVEFPFQ